MTTYSKLNVIYRLQKWMDSVPGQTFLNYAYSWGASIVILGTLFKLTHMDGADFFLFLGMGTEVLVFFLSAFDRPFDKTTDGMELDTHVRTGEDSLVTSKGGSATVVGGVVGGGSAGASGPVVIGGGATGGGGTVIIGGGNVPAGDGENSVAVAEGGASISGPIVIGGGGSAVGGGPAVVSGNGPAVVTPSAPHPELDAATAENGVDATFLIVAANFNRNDLRNKAAWTGDDFSVGGDATNTNAEKWGGNSQTFDIKQTIELPNGVYKVTWNGFYRYNNTSDNTNDVAVAAHAEGTEVINSFVYLNDKDFALTSIADETATAALQALDKGIPFSQADASFAFANGIYEQSAEIIVTEGTLTIGIKKIEHLGTDWTVWDNFRLTYYGAPVNDDDPELEGLCFFLSAVYLHEGNYPDNYSWKTPGKLSPQDVNAILTYYNLMDIIMAEDVYWDSPYIPVGYDFPDLFYHGWEPMKANP